jgi:predicted ArsR family transcriptional regulator
MLSHAQKTQRRAELQSSAVRDQIVQVLAAAQGQALGPTQVSEVLGLKPPAVAHHFTTLANAGVLNRIQATRRVRLYVLANPDRDVPLGDKALALLTLCGALAVPTARHGLPALVRIDEPARALLNALIDELRPQVVAVARAAEGRATG